jgi:hypothetical protein
LGVETTNCPPGEIGEGKLGGAGLLIYQIGANVVFGGVGDGVGADVDAGDGGSAVGQFGRTVAGAAPDIEDTLAAGEAGGEGVAGEVFVPEVDVDLAGDDAFAGELSAHGRPPVVLAGGC